jgi:hypothetical protein
MKMIRTEADQMKEGKPTVENQGDTPAIYVLPLR